MQRRRSGDRHICRACILLTRYDVLASYVPGKNRSIGMSFSISFLDEPVIYDESDRTAAGRLVIGDWEEVFVSSLFHWSKEDYEAQWLNAIKLLLKIGRASCRERVEDS